MDMVKLAIASNTHFKFSSMEMNEDGYSYTYLTLEKLNEKHPDTRYYFIIGADSLFDFKGWRNPQRICDACDICNVDKCMAIQECHTVVSGLKYLVGCDRAGCAVSVYNDEVNACKLFRILCKCTSCKVCVAACACRNNDRDCAARCPLRCHLSAACCR